MKYGGVLNSKINICFVLFFNEFLSIIIIQRMEREATFRYKTLTVEHDEAANCLNVNESVIYRQDTPDTVSLLSNMSLFSFTK